jgi:hypothetical protein
MWLKKILSRNKVPIWLSTDVYRWSIYITSAGRYPSQRKVHMHADWPRNKVGTKRQLYVREKEYFGLVF